MSAIIDTSNGRENFAFVGKTAWHGLGNRIDPNSTIEKWQEMSGLNFTLVSGQPFVIDDEGRLIEFSDNAAIYRTDTGAPMSIMGSRYKLVQPADILEAFREGTTGTGWQIETAGSLKGGRVVWALAADGQHGNVGTDKVISRALLATSCDGSLATVARPTTIRVVCNNTLTAALSRDKDKAVKIRHSTAVDSKKLQTALESAHDDFPRFIDAAKQLQQRRMNDREVRDFFTNLYPPIKSKTKTKTRNAASFSELMNGPANLTHSSIIGEERAVATVLKTGFKPSRMVERLMNVYHNGYGQESCQGTAWGAVNAVSRYFDHEGGHNPDSRLSSAWFGSGETQKNTAMTKALELV